MPSSYRSRCQICRRFFILLSLFPVAHKHSFSGRLSTTKLIESNDEDLAEMLIEVRGIGRVRLSSFFVRSGLRVYSGPVRTIR
jgi:hypothetical protein